MQNIAALTTYRFQFNHISHKHKLTIEALSSHAVYNLEWSSKSDIIHVMIFN